MSYDQGWRLGKLPFTWHVLTWITRTEVKNTENYSNILAELEYIWLIRQSQSSSVSTLTSQYWIFKWRLQVIWGSSKKIFIMRLWLFTQCLIKLGSPRHTVHSAPWMKYNTLMHTLIIQSVSQTCIILVTGRIHLMWIFFILAIRAINTTFGNNI